MIKEINVSEKQGDSAFELYGVCIYMSRLATADKWNGCLEQPEAIFIIFARLGRAGLGKNPGGRLKTLELGKTIIQFSNNRHA